MREKLMTLPLATLRQFAKDQDVPQYYHLKKQELVEALVEIYEAQKKEESSSAAPAPAPAKETQANESPKAEPKQKKRGRPLKNMKKETVEEPAKQQKEEVPEEPKKAEEPSPAPAEKPDAKDAPAPSDAEKNAFQGPAVPKTIQDLDSGVKGCGILEVLPDGYGFLRSKGYYSGENDIYVAPSQIKRFSLRTGDYIVGTTRIKQPNEKLTALLLINSINGVDVSVREKPVPFENLTPTFPHEKLTLETTRSDISVRIIDLLSPIGKGQRGMIVAQPKVGKTTLLKQIASSLLTNHPELHIMILLIDERPEEVTDMQDTFANRKVEIIYSTFDETPEHHRQVSEIVIERAKRLVEMKKDVVILLDSITRLTRACNLTCVPTGRTLSGGLDPAALYMPKRFFGAARCMKEGGSLTILATALQETGSRMDDVVYEEFKGTGNMELVLNRKLSERRIFPAIDILKSSTRRDDLLLSKEEQDAAALIHKVTTLGSRPETATEQILDLFADTKSNYEFINRLKGISFY